MFWLLFTGGSIVSGYLGDYLWARRRGVKYADWSFLTNRSALLVGAAVAVVMAALSISGGLTSFFLALPFAVLWGGLAALTADRVGPFKAVRHGDH